jgi:regulator of protease activity HflC (stomatin/prohibitin superfamily)
VGVIKANFGSSPTDVVRTDTGEVVSPDQLAGISRDLLVEFAKPGEIGIRREVLAPGKYPINTDAFTVVEIYSTQMVSHYTAAHGGSGPLPSGSGTTPVAEEREITVRTADGFTFPVDVRVEYVVEPRYAPVAVAKLGDDEGERFRNALNSAVRAIFRNNAENVRALDYVQQRSHQESQSLTMLKQQMGPFGVRVTAVRIGNVGDQATLGALLKTQTDRELAKQEQQTFQEQQRAAEQKKQLARAQQESDEEKKLATATYAVKIAAEDQKKRVAEAEGEAQAIKIKAQAQADAYRLIAEQIGKNNAALVELLKVVGERNIQITPRVFMSGEHSGQSMSTALMGTMLDQMISRDEAAAQPEPRN